MGLFKKQNLPSYRYVPSNEELNDSIQHLTRTLGDLQKEVAEKSYRETPADKKAERLEKAVLLLVEGTEHEKAVKAFLDTWDD